MPTEPGHRSGPASRRLIGYSANRTLFREQREGGVVRLLKVFETGSMADAEGEMRAAEVLAGAGIARCHAARIDEASGKPALELDYLPGTDLGHLIRAEGPLPTATALRVAHGLATILRRLDAISSDLAPHGVVHCDVKPSNVLVDGGPPDRSADVAVHLIDLEHSAPAADPAATAGPTDAFQGGTHGFAPPEAYDGALPTRAFDVFGFGCCLHSMLTGETPPAQAEAPRHRRHALVAVPLTLRTLFEDCTARDPRDRPDWDEILTRLDSCAEESDRSQALDAVRLAVIASDFSGATKAVAALDSQAATEFGPRLTRWIERSKRLRRAAARTLPEPQEVAAATLAHLAVHGQRVHAALQRFAADAECRAARDAVLDALLDRLLDAPTQIKTHAKNGAFGTAKQWIDDARAAIHACAVLGQLPASTAADGTIPKIARAPERVIDLAEREITSAASDHDRVLARVESAESALDLDAIQTVLVSVADSHGGASEITANLKERAHRFEFAMSQIAGGASALEECRRLMLLTGVHVDMEPVQQFVARCAEIASSPRQTPCRALLRGLDSLLKDFPHLAPVVAPASNRLREALSALTDAAWDAVHEAESLLKASPVPIRPLQAEVNRLDRLDLAGGLIDQKNRTRTDLLDALENIRLHVDRARATRDRIARGAEEAMDQGHLTTALYEMERAARQFDDETSQAHGQPMSDRYAAAKRLKEQIEDAQRTNHELAARYRAAVDDSAASASRAELLEERERVLSFLCGNVGEHRSRLYESDLGTVRFERFELTAEIGNERLQACESDAARIEVAEQIASALAMQIPASGWSGEQRELAHRTVAEWRERSGPPRGHRRAEGRAGRLVGAVAAVVLGIASITWGWATLVSAKSVDLQRLSDDLMPAMAWHDDADGETAALARLRNFHAAMHNSDAPRSVSAAAQDLLTAAESTRITDTDWLDHLRVAIERYDIAIGSKPTEALHRFGIAAHTTACIRAARSGVDLAEHLERCGESRLAPPRELAKRLREVEPK